MNWGKLFIGLTLAAVITSLPTLHAADKPGMNEATFKGLELRGIGPAFMSGRVADIAIDPDVQSTWYVAVGSGGVWKTKNAGTTWTNIFDGQGSFSIGAVTIDPNNSQTIWVGSGENVSGRHVGFGDGVYVSYDGGENWENKGLKKSEHIGMIRVDPRDSDVIFVAAQGPLWSSGGERGLYKSVDGGDNWKRVLKGNQFTGAGEVHFDPRNPDVMYATTWQRLRNVAALMNGGPESGIHKSTDGGKTWNKLTKGLPEGNIGKIGFTVSPMRPDVVYATIELDDRKGAFYRSDNGGANWTKQSDFVSSGTGPHYYQEIYASPHVFDRIYHMDVFLHISSDGGKNFEKTKYNDKHVDHHAIAFNPDNENYLLVGTDGGLYESYDHGSSWRFMDNLPVTQFYKVAVDYDLPFYNVYGGTQDNNSQGGPSRTDNFTGIRNSDWFVTLGGDGHQSAADPDNPDIVYAQWQQGNLMRFDRKTGEVVYIKPQPGKGEPAERFNWDSPILISPHDSKTLYFGSNRVWRSDNRGDAWTVISDDLSRQINRLQEPMMGRRWNDQAPWDLYAMSMFGTVTSLSESPLQQGLLYAGTDDGLIQISGDGGGKWEEIDSLPGVADYFFVNDIKADLHDADTVYVAVDQHKNGDFKPYLFKSTNRGKSWRSIAGNLPARHIVWRVVQDHVNPNLLFAGTEFGVFFTLDGGKMWVKLTGNVPTIAFRDLVIQKRENDLVGATFGRGFYIFDDYSPLRNLDPAALADQQLLFPVRKTPWYIPRAVLGCYQENCVSSRGAAFFNAPNPAYGATITYYLPEELKSQHDVRIDADKEAIEKGNDIVFPSFDTLSEEALEQEPAVVLIIKDADGKVLRHIEGPVTAGFHRVAWDLRFNSKVPYDPPEDPTPWNTPPSGPMVAPGTYSVSFATRVNGELLVQDQTEKFEVAAIRTPTLTSVSQSARVDFMQGAEEFIHKITSTSGRLGERITQLEAAMSALRRSGTHPDLNKKTLDMLKTLKRHQLTLSGDPNQGRYNQQQTVSISSRAWFGANGNDSTTYGPTETQKMSLGIAREDLQTLETQLNPILQDQLPALFKQLDDAGIPWSSGR